ncbi:MAG TPA: PrsW family glutamic-type intramembrane protease [Candidatus Cloacimonadota bacterium]|nr:PrsW family glutamic-type intramembrane protease [Candidatus Cloacimonadota bacterium]
MLRILISLLPVFAFLGMLVVLDNYRLLKPRKLLQSGGIGCTAALIAFGVNKIALLVLDTNILQIAIAPVVEESLKALWPLLLLRRGRIGFIADGAIIGFAVGSGFALVENCYYLLHVQDANLMLWILRGFGTALMHGGTTAVCIMMAVVAEQRSSKGVFVLPGLVTAIIIHSFFNLFLLPPLTNTILQVVSLPLLMMVLFSMSEKQTAVWLQQGFDTDVALLEQLRSGKFSKTPQGLYLAGFRNSFSGEIVLDLFCYLRIYLELAIRAKGILLMRESGLIPVVDDEIKAKFEELSYLGKSIGKMGKTVLKPLLHSSQKELWQIYFLQEQG